MYTHRNMFVAPQLDTQGLSYEKDVRVYYNNGQQVLRHFARIEKLRDSPMAERSQQSTLKTVGTFKAVKRTLVHYTLFWTFSSCVETQILKL